MAQKTLIKKKLIPFVYSSGQRVTQTLDRDGILYQLNLDVQFTVTNGGTGPVGPLAFTLARIIQSVELTINGVDTIIRMTGEQIASRALLEQGQIPYGMDATVVLTNSAATVYRVILPIPLWLPHSVRPTDTGLECRTLDQVNLAITFADSNCSQLFTTPNSAAISAVTCLVQGQYLQTDASEIKKLSDPSYLIRAMDYIIQPNTGTNAQLSVQMDRGPQFYRSFHILTERGNVAADNILNNIKLQAGSFVFFDESSVMNRANLLADNGLYAAPAANAPVTGVYSLQTAKFGSLDTAINVNPQVLLTDLFLYFDTTYTSGTENIIISREAIRKPNL